MVLLDSYGLCQRFETSAKESMHLNVLHEAPNDDLVRRVSQ